MGNSVLVPGEHYRWEGDWIFPMDDGFHQPGTARSYTLLNTDAYEGSTQVSVGITSPKSEYISNNCVRDNKTGLLWLSNPPSAIGPASDGKLRWDDHCDVVEITGLSGTFQQGELITESVSPSYSAVIRYADNDGLELSVINPSGRPMSISATITSASATATISAYAEGNGEDIWAYVRAVNDAEVAGFSDWRVANQLELASILYLSVTNGDAYPDESYFGSTGLTDVFSSSHAGYSSHLCHSVRFDTGSTLRTLRKFSDSAHVFLVRGPIAGNWPCRVLKTGCVEQCDGGYPCDGYYQAGDGRSYEEVDAGTGPETFYLQDTDQGSFAITDYYIKDLQTGLWWSKECVKGLIVESKGMVKWYDEDGLRADAWEIVRECNEAEFCGYSDWRLPTVFEAATITDLSTATADLDSSVFDDADLPFWTGTTAPGDTGNVYRQSGSGSLWGSGVDRKTSATTYVRLVRSGG